MDLKNLTEHQFLGIVLPDLDPERMGRYKIHIPKLMPHLDYDQGIWCKNQVHNWRMTHSDKGEYGQYFPLHSGTHVIVNFFRNDMNSGYIDRIISDYYSGSDTLAQDNVKAKSVLEDRDEQYILFKTPKKWNAFYINEETEKEPNTIYLIYNRDNSPERRTVYRVDETGITIWTRDNRRIRVKTDENKQVDGNQTEYIKGYRTKHIDKRDDLYVHNSHYETIDKDFEQWIKQNLTTRVQGNTDELTEGNSTIEINGNCNITVNGETNVSGAGNINIDAPTVNINSGIASPKPAKRPEVAKPKTHVRDLGPKETSEYDMTDSSRSGRPIATGKKCDDVTKDYNTDNVNPDSSMLK